MTGQQLTEQGEFRWSMKIRANHVLSTTTADFNVSFENELRYTAIGDVADLAPGASGVYGKELIRDPVDFPLAFEFEGEDERDAFVCRLRRS